MPSHSFPTAHGWCLLWDWNLIATTITADAMIALAYFSIPWSLFLFVNRFAFNDPTIKRAFLAFVVFITLCGLTHVMDIVTIFQPWYWLNTWIRVATAIASIGTAALLYPALVSVIEIAKPSGKR